MLPEVFRSAAKMARAVSVRPEPSKPGKADDLAPADVETGVVHPMADWNVLGSQQLAADLAAAAFEGRRALLLHFGEIAAQHARNQLQLGDVLHRRDGDGAAVAHDGDAVADLVEFVELVADEDHGNAFGLQLADRAQQHGNFRLVERGCRLVHDHQPASKETARAIATICWMAVENRSSGSRTSTFTSKRARSAAASAFILAQSSRPKDRLGSRPKKDVLGHRAVADQVDFLEDGADAGALRLLRRSRSPRGCH